MNQIEFRKALVNIMPGYEWTVHKPKHREVYFRATGIQSAGLNRISTLQVIYQFKDGFPWYEVMSSGYGRRSNWLHSESAPTLAQALRQLQQHYVDMEQIYKSHLMALQVGRRKKKAK